MDDITKFIKLLGLPKRFDWGKPDQLAKKHAYLHDYLIDICPVFENIKVDDLSVEDYDLLHVYFLEWVEFLCTNYYTRKLSIGITSKYMHESEMPFYGFSTRQIINLSIIEDDLLIQNGFFDTLGMHFNIVFMNFFRLLYSNHETDELIAKLDYTNIDNVICEFIKLWKVDYESPRMEKLLLCLYGWYSKLYFGEDVIIEENTEIEIDTKEDVFTKNKKRVKRIQTRCTPHQIFSSIHFFVNTWVMLHPELIFPNYNPDLKVVRLNSVNVELKKFMQTTKFTDKVLDEIERTLYCYTLYPGLREVFIYSKVFNKESDEFINKVKLLGFRPRRQKEATRDFQNSLSKRIDGFNLLMHNLNYFWDEDKFIDKEEITPAFKMLMHHFKVQSQMVYSYWHERFTRLQEAVMKDPEEIIKYSQKTPILLKLHPYNFCICHKGVIFNGSMDSLLQYWCEVNKNIGIIPFPELAECNTIRVIKKLVPGFVKLDKITHSQNIVKNMISYEVKQVVVVQQSEREESVQKKKKTGLSLLGIKK